MTNDNLDRSIRAIVGDARPTPEAEAAMDDAFAAIAQEAAARAAKAKSKKKAKTSGEENSVDEAPKD